MDVSTNTVLVITGDDADADVIQASLATARDGPFCTERAADLSAALARLGKGGVDIVLVDLFLRDSRGIGTFDTLFSLVSPTPILVLCAEKNEATAIEAVQRGAQGYLSKGHFSDALIPQALRSIIQRKRVEESLYVEKERARVTLECIGDGVLSTDVSGSITYLNAQAERMTGWTRDEARGQPIAEVLHLIDGQTREPARNPVEMVIAHGKNLALYARSVLVRRDGYETPVEDSAAPIFNKAGAVTGAVVTFRDVSEIRAMADKMAHLAEHDYLTGLPNRLLLGDRLEQAISYAQRHHTQIAVLFLDLDNFKHINDSLGHSIGDKLLESVSKRLVAQVRHSDTVSRLGGDEFVIMVLEESQAKHSTIAAEKVLRAFGEPHLIAGRELHITTSIGISIFPADGEDGETLIKNADIAMYHAKKKGRNNFQFFNSEMNVWAVQRQATETELRKAVDRNEFVVHYQPKIDLASGKVTGAEALVRWHHPQKGLVFPDSFIPVAEESGLIVMIGKIVLRETCRQVKIWLNEGLEFLVVSLNVSALEFRDRSFIGNMRQVLEEIAVPPGSLQVELTESVLMRNVDASIPILHELKDMGVQLAVDDFGTGYSSLSYLSRFPIDVLKIDQSFVQRISADSGDGIIASAVIGMGASLRQKVIAEGIETQEQLQFLNTHHCNEGQGFLFSAPIPPEDFGRFVRQNAVAPTRPN